MGLGFESQADHDDLYIRHNVRFLRTIRFRIVRFFCFPLCPIGQRTQCGLFHLSEVSRKCAPNDLLDQLGGTTQSLLQAHLAHAWSDAFSRFRGLSFGLCCQGENRRDVCKSTAVFSGMENQVKRQRNVNITNSPPAWGTPSWRGRREENLTHFFGHYRIDHRIQRLSAKKNACEEQKEVNFR